MAKDFVLKCKDCGYLFQCENDMLACLTSPSSICEHCGSANMEIVQQQGGQFGCIGRMGTRDEDVKRTEAHNAILRQSK